MRSTHLVDITLFLNILFGLANEEIEIPSTDVYYCIQGCEIVEWCGTEESCKRSIRARIADIMDKEITSKERRTNARVHFHSPIP